MKCFFSVICIFLFSYQLSNAQSNETSADEEPITDSFSQIPPVENRVIYKIVEMMPRFPGCEQIDGTNKDKRSCAKEKLEDYIYKNLEYPEIALKENVEGTCVVQFFVENDGSISNINLVRNIGSGCGDAAVKVVSSMKYLPEKWTPGTHRDTPVAVLYTLPIRFKLPI